MVADSKLSCWQGNRKDTRYKRKNCTACTNARDNLWTQFPKTEKGRTTEARKMGKKIQLGFTGKITTKKNKKENTTFSSLRSFH